MAELIVTGFVAEIPLETTLAVVDFPCPGGGALGVTIDPGRRVAVGDRIPVTATVVEESRDKATVTVRAFDGSDQSVVIDLGRAAVEKVASDVEPTPP